MIDEGVIVSLDWQGLLSQEMLYDLTEIPEAEERARIQALLVARAKELGMQKEYSAVLRAYNKASEQLAAEYKKASASRRQGISLDYDGNGKPLVTVDNFLQVLENDSYFAGLKYNLLTRSPEIERGGEIVRWTDADDAETRRFIEKKYHFHSVQKCDDALRIVFSRNSYHPIRDLIDSMQWDGVSRIWNFLHRWTQCDDTPYTREVSRLIFSGGIHRIYNPGCKFDDMAVLIGTRQGEGKSTLIRWLALKDEWFTEVNEFEGQRGIEAIEGGWICEVSELLALTKAKEQEAVKSYLTRLNDRYRMPFDKRTTDHPRQCIFIGTTNKEQFLTDRTGNRRYYPVRVQQSGYDLFEHEVECREYIRQCWAEAKYLYDRGELRPYADRQLIDEIRAAQEGAVEDDYRVGMIQAYLETKYETCIMDLWVHALGNEYGKPSKKESNEISLIIQSIAGWIRQPAAKRFAEWGVQKWWAREKTPPPLPHDIDDLPM